MHDPQPTFLKISIIIFEKCIPPFARWLETKKWRAEYEKIKNDEWFIQAYNIWPHLNNPHITHIESLLGHSEMYDIVTKEKNRFILTKKGKFMFMTHSSRG